MSDYSLRAGNRIVRGCRTDEEPVFSGGYGGYEAVARPKKPDLTVYTGRRSFQLTLPMLLDGFIDRRSVEDDIHDLNLLATGTVGQGPPPVTVDGVRFPARAGDTWAINDVIWGDAERRHDEVRIRQQVTVTLIEVTTDKQLRESTLSAINRGQPVHYRVKHGDTLLTIAAKQLGDAKRWPDIAALNNLRSTGQLKVGMQLRLP